MLNKFKTVHGLFLLIVAILVGLSVCTSGHDVRRYAVFALFSYLVIALVSKSFKRVKLSELLLLFFVWWVLASLFWKQTDTTIMGVFFDYFGMASCFYLGRRSIRSKEDMNFLFVSYLLGASFSSILVIINWKFGISLDDSGRFTAGDLNANYVAYTIATGMAVILMLMKNRVGLDSNFLKAMYIFLIVVMIFAIGLTGSRGALTSSLIVLFFIFINGLRSRLLLTLSIAMMLVTVSVFLFDYLPDFIQARLLSSDGDSGDVLTGRGDIWSYALELMFKSPLLGLGIGSFEYIVGYHTHNVFLSVIVETGIVGLLLYFSVILITVFEKQHSKVGVRYFLRWEGIIFFLSWIPIAMTGVWVISPASWFVFGFVSAYYDLYYNKTPSTRVIEIKHTQGIFL